MAAWFEHERQRDKSNRPSAVADTGPILIDVADLVKGTGRWENMQEILRSAIKAILDTQASQQQQLQQMRAFIMSSCKRIGKEKASREDLARATTGCTENTSRLAKLSGDVATSTESCRVEAADLRARLETKISRENLVAHLECKASQSDLLELRGRLGRVCSEADTVEVRAKQKTLALEKRFDVLEASVRGCEAHVIRADPAAIALRIETVASGLRGLIKRVDRKCDAQVIERALEEKVDKQALDASLSSKIDRADLANIEASAASLLALSRERAATAANLEHDLRTATAETATLRLRADGHDRALAKLHTKVAQQQEKRGRETFERRVRGLEKRVVRAEKGLAMVVAEVGARVTEVTRRCRNYGRAERKSVVEAVEALAKRVEDWDPSRRQHPCVIEAKALQERVLAIEGTLAIAVDSKANSLDDDQVSPCDEQGLGRPKHPMPAKSVVSAIPATALKVEEKRESIGRARYSSSRQRGCGMVAAGAVPVGAPRRRDARSESTHPRRLSEAPRAREQDGREKQSDGEPELQRCTRPADTRRIGVATSELAGRKRLGEGTRADGGAAGGGERERAESRSLLSTPGCNKLLRPKRGDHTKTNHAHRRDTYGRSGGNQAGQRMLFHGEESIHLRAGDGEYAGRMAEHIDKTRRCDESSNSQGQANDEVTSPAESWPFFRESCFTSSRSSSLGGPTSSAETVGQRQHHGRGSQTRVNERPSERGMVSPSNRRRRASPRRASRAAAAAEHSPDQPELQGRASSATVTVKTSGALVRKSGKTEGGNHFSVVCSTGTRSNPDSEKGIECKAAAETEVVRPRTLLVGEDGESMTSLNTPVVFERPRRHDTGNIRGDDDANKGTRIGPHRSETEEEEEEEEEEEASGNTVNGKHKETAGGDFATGSTLNNVGPPLPGASRASLPSYPSTSASSEHGRRELSSGTSCERKYRGDRRPERRPTGNPRKENENVSGNERPNLYGLGGVEEYKGGVSGGDDADDDDDDSAALKQRIEELRKEKEVFRAMVERGGT